MKHRVSIIEDSDAVRGMLEQSILRSRDMDLCSSFSCAEDALQELADHRPDVVLVDVQLPGITGIELVERMRPALHDAVIIMLTVCNDPPRILAALKAGADGYLLKQLSGREMLEAVRKVVNGEAPMSGAVAQMIIQSFRRNRTAMPDGSLSVREHEVLNLVARGLSNREIASELDLSSHTVSSHLRSCYSKLHARNKLEALRKSGKLGT